MNILAAGSITAACLYGVWFAAVVQKATHSRQSFGPRWLAVSASGVLYRFGSWYLNFSIDTEEAVKAGKFDPSKQYFMVWHPHGAFTIAALYFFSHIAAKSVIFPGRRLFCAVADLLLRIPGLAEFLLLCNARSASSKMLDNVLSSGGCIAIQPGGLIEQVSTDHTKERLFFPRRLGFIRVAIKHGVPLLPCYAFGENQLYDTSPWLRKVNMWLYTNFKVGSLFVHAGHCGRFPVTPLLPSPLLLPVPGRNLSFRWGEAVDVGPPDPNPSDEKVMQVFEKYKAALQKLFEEHKDSCLPAEVAAAGLELVLRSK